MTPERWRQIEQLYHSALNCGTDELAAFLEKSCGGDEALRQEVEALLANEGEAKGFIEAPALEAAVKMAAENRQSLVGRQVGPTKLFRCWVQAAWERYIWQRTPGSNGRSH
jgi:eukaryotic-like serine/threonine-protein kinase